MGTAITAMLRPRVSLATMDMHLMHAHRMVTTALITLRVDCLSVPVPGFVADTDIVAGTEATVGMDIAEATG